MKFHSSVIIVKDIEVSKNFYTEIMDQTIEHDFGKNIIFKNGLSIWELRPDHIIAKNLETQGSANRFELYFEDENLPSIFTKLKNANVEFLHEIHEEPWGQRTIRFFDPDSHLVEVGEPLEIFLRNMYDNGITPEEISAKSGVNVETVNILLGI